MLSLLLLSGDIELHPGPTDCYKFYYQNATSIRSKLSDFNAFLAACEFDFIFISATWLDENIFDGEVLTDLPYNLYRRDRSSETSSKRTGGGDFIAVKNNLTSTRRDQFETGLEIVWVEVFLPGQSLYLASVYIPPDASPEEKSVDNVCRSMGRNDSILLDGDFN